MHAWTEANNRDDKDLLIILQGPFQAFLGRVGIDEQKWRPSMVVIGEIDHGDLPSPEGDERDGIEKVN